MQIVRLSLVALFSLLITDVSSVSAMQRRRRSTPQPGIATNVKWSPDGKAVYFTTLNKRYKFDLESKEKSEFTGKEEAAAGEGGGGPARRVRFGRGLGAGNTGKQLGRPTRGRQHTAVESPDGKWTAKYVDWNVVVERKSSNEKIQVTTDGNETIHYGTASWVYGEELNQTTAMWWTPDSKKLLFYKLTTPA